jgi:hypothetical protein
MKHLIIVLVAFFSVAGASAQKIVLNAYGTYVFRDRVGFDHYTGYVNEGFQYGGGFEFYADHSRSIELKYLRQDTHFPLYNNGGSQLNASAEKGSVNYILLSGNNYVVTNPHSKAIPFGGLGLGVGIIDAQGGTTTKFAWDAKLGVKVQASSSIAIKFHASLQSIISTFGSDFYYTGAGTAIAVPDYATLFQFGLGGALCFTLK